MITNIFPPKVAEEKKELFQKCVFTKDENWLKFLDASFIKSDEFIEKDKQKYYQTLQIN